MPEARDRVSAIVDSVISLGNKTGEEVSITVTKQVVGGFEFEIDGHYLPTINKAEEYVADLHEDIGEEEDTEVAKVIADSSRRVKSLQASMVAIQEAIDLETEQHEDSISGDTES